MYIFALAGETPVPLCRLRAENWAALEREGRYMSTEKKRHMHFELTEKQYQLLSEQAKQCGLSRRAYLARLIEGKSVKACPFPEIGLLRTEIHHIGNNIVRPDRALCKAEKWYCPAR